jgi:para-aminobenzoate synthetase component 2
MLFYISRMILVIDNYDSFVYNLARYCALAGWTHDVRRNDAISLDDIAAMQPEAIVISPGPCSPAEAGICVEMIKRLGPSIPILGVCLGHQCIGAAYGAAIPRAPVPMHGKASAITHDGTGIFETLPSPIMAGRYHSLCVELAEASPLEVTGRGPENEIMALQHKEFPVYGVQFHPESVLTPQGLDIIKNFTALALRWNERKKAAA